MGCNSSKKAKSDDAAAPTLLAVAGKGDPEAATDDTKPEPATDDSAGNTLPGPLVPIKVTIVSARGLRNADIVGKSDPYVICDVVGKPTRADVVTSVTSQTVKNDLNPAWNEELDMSGYQVGDAIVFTVNDADTFKTDDFLGQVTLQPGQFFEDGFDGEVPLTDAGKDSAGKDVEAFLTLKIVVRHPTPASMEQLPEPEPEVKQGEEVASPAAEEKAQPQEELEPELETTVVAPKGWCC